MKKHLLFSALCTALVAFGIHAQAQTQVMSIDDVTDGFYQIKSVGQVYNAGNWEMPEGEMWYTSYSEEFSAAANNRYYPMGINPMNEEQIGRTFVYLEAYGEGWSIKAMNGHYLSGNSQASVTPYGHVLMDGADNGTFMFQHICGFTEDTWASTKENAEYYGIVGKSTNNGRPVEIYTAPVADYDVYQVIYDYPEEIPSQAYPYDNPSVLYTGEGCLSVAKVYDGGYYVFPKGTKVDLEAFQCPEFENYDAEVIIDDNLLVISYAAAVDMQEVTYHYFYGDDEIGSEIINAVIGEPWPEPKFSEFPYGVTAHAPEGTADWNTFDIDIQVVFEGLPFEFETEISSFDDIKHWYSLDMRDGQFLVYSDTLEYIDMSAKAVDHTQENNFKWAFVGNPFDGFKVVNAAAGYGKVLANVNNFDNDTNTGAQTQPSMQEEADLSEYSEVWQFAVAPSSSIANVDGFYMGFSVENDGHYTYMNFRDGRLAYWTGGQDSGSTFRATELFGAQTTLAVAIEKAEKMLADAYPTIGEIGFGTIDNYKALEAATAEGKAVYGTELTEEELFAYVEAINAAMKAFNEEVTMPKDGVRYSFTNHQKGDTIRYVLYMNEEGLQRGEANQTAEELGDAAYFVCHASEANEGLFYFTNCATDNYLVWKGHQGGVNGNSGFVAEYDSTYCDFAFYGVSDTYPGGFVINGKREDGRDGTFIFLTDGTFNAYSLAIGFTDSFSNIFTLSAAPTREWSEWEPFEGGQATFTYTLCFSGEDTLNIYSRHDVDDPAKMEIKLEQWAFGADFVFNYNAESGICKVPFNHTAYQYQDASYDEEIMVSDLPTKYSDDTYQDWPCWYDEATRTFNLNLIYTISAGYFGNPGIEQAVIIEGGENVGKVLNDATDAPIYDLFGRKVDNMQKGVIYIQNGQKILK